ncbi:unnamed protein product [Symbiodinium natans]|uniref:Uncharacterized protein n=1 Tax=Symbiodinium natans TaxID=878477 RepID=A0A812SI76_9DINO|nr:unnamed protein product [Symbiodinium natans]
MAQQDFRKLSASDDEAEQRELLKQSLILQKQKERPKCSESKIRSVGLKVAEESDELQEAPRTLRYQMQSRPRVTNIPSAFCKELDVKRNEREVAAADNEVRRLKADLEAAKNELEPLEEHSGQFTSCIFTSTFMIRGLGACDFSSAIAFPVPRYYAQVKQRCEKKVTREDILQRRKREIEGRGESTCFGISAKSRKLPMSAKTAGADSLQALLLDCDGVIADSEYLHREAYNEVFAEFEVDAVWSKEYYDVLQNKIGGGKPKMRYHFGEVGWPTSVKGPPPEDEMSREALIDALQDRKTDIYRGYVTSGKASARPGILALIEEGLQRRNLRMAICSAGTKEAAQQVLSAVVGEDLLEQFDLILLGDDVSRKKPDPLIYKLASERLGVPAERCAVVEDSKIGLEAALAAGMRCFITYTDSTQGQDFSGATEVLPDATQLQLSKIFPS